MKIKTKTQTLPSQRQVHIIFHIIRHLPFLTVCCTSVWWNFFVVVSKMNLCKLKQNEVIHNQLFTHLQEFPRTGELVQPKWSKSFFLPHQIPNEFAKKFITFPKCVKKEIVIIKKKSCQKTAYSHHDLTWA